MFGSTTESLVIRGLDLAALGSAYLFFLASLVLTIGVFLLSRSLLVISPNRAAKHYGIYVVMVLVTIVVAAVLENEVVPEQATTLPYAVLPHLLVLLTIHLRIYYDQQPWLIALGASSIVGTMTATLVVAAATPLIQVSHWLTLALLSGLLGYLWLYSISTTSGFMKARSIYTDSKEGSRDKVLPQKPWLGLAQWVALCAASLILTTVNSVLRGSGIADVPAVEVLGQSTFLIGVTATVCAIPAATYWLAHKNWMPELTRFVWLVWVVVGFAFTYNNFLGSLERV